MCEFTTSPVSLLDAEVSVEYSCKRSTTDADGSHELFTHLLPFATYAIEYSCGPDPQVCCSFDYYSNKSNSTQCPAIEVTDDNILVRFVYFSLYLLETLIIQF